MKFILPLILLFSCGVEPKKFDRPTNYDLLKAEYDKKLVESSSWKNGWPSLTDCDGTLWAGLAKYAGVKVDLHLAEHKPGEVHRRPELPCFANGVDLGSKSTTSNDMLSGYILGFKDDKITLSRFYNKAKNNNWRTGQSLWDASDRVFLSTNLRRYLGVILKDPASLPIELVYLPSNTDFERHLTSIGVLIANDIGIKLKNHNIVVMRANYNKDPNDAFTAAVLGRFEKGYTEKAVDLLLGEYNSPTYVRGDDNYHLVHWLAAAKVILETKFEG